jgi:hypothetical protein
MHESTILKRTFKETVCDGANGLMSLSRRLSGGLVKTGK